jgi:HK97 gp10 family phage protein
MIEYKVRGIEDVVKALREVPAKLAKRALLDALKAGGRIVRDDARAHAPLLKLSTYAGLSAYRRGIRKPGTVRAAISVRTSKLARRAGDVGVFVNVRPAKAGQRGARSKVDPFYWRWLEFGWTPGGGRRVIAAVRRVRRRSLAQGIAREKPGQRFLTNAARKLVPDALNAITAKIRPALEKINNRQTP